MFFSSFFYLLTARKCDSNGGHENEARIVRVIYEAFDQKCDQGRRESEMNLMILAAAKAEDGMDDDFHPRIFANVHTTAKTNFPRQEDTTRVTLRRELKFALCSRITYVRIKEEASR